MEKSIVPQPQRESYLKYRRDVTRQILLPTILATLLILGLGGLAIYSTSAGSQSVSLWADIALIWLIIPMMFLAIVILALLAALAYGLARLLGIAPQYTGLVQEYALWLNAEIVLWTNHIIQPVLVLKTWLGFIIKEEAHDPQGKD